MKAEGFSAFTWVVGLLDAFLQRDRVRRWGWHGFSDVTFHGTIVYSPATDGRSHHVYIGIAFTACTTRPVDLYLDHGIAALARGSRETKARDVVSPRWRYKSMQTRGERLIQLIGLSSSFKVKSDSDESVERTLRVTVTS